MSALVFAFEFFGEVSNLASIGVVALFAIIGIALFFRFQSFDKAWLLALQAVALVVAVIIALTILIAAVTSGTGLEILGAPLLWLGAILTIASAWPPVWLYALWRLHKQRAKSLQRSDIFE